MGLDMYLSKRTYVKNWSRMSPEEKHTVNVHVAGKLRKDIKKSRISYIVEEVMYWRKANHIHLWFVENCQGGVDECQESGVSREQLDELATLCERVVKEKNPELLPTASGFFFGSTDYDEYYYQDCKDTAKEIRKLLAEQAPEGKYSGEFSYHASW